MAVPRKIRNIPNIDLMAFCGAAVEQAAIQHETIDRLAELMALNGEIALKTVGRNEKDVIVRGAKILATLGPFAGEILVYPAGPLPPGSPAEHALMFSLPVGTKSVIQVCRDHYGTHGRPRRSHRSKTNGFSKIGLGQNDVFMQIAAPTAGVEDMLLPDGAQSTASPSARMPPASGYIPPRVPRRAHRPPLAQRPRLVA